MSNYNNFHYALSLTDSLYGITMPEDVWEEIALVGWGLIGNKRTRTYKYSVCMDSCKEPIIELPCNCDILEAVTTSWEDWNHITNIEPEGLNYSAVTEQYIEHRKAFHDPLYASGKFIKYERIGNTLYLDKHYNRVNILYRGIILDEEGLPELTDKEALAIATYCAYVSKYKEGLATNNTNMINLSSTLKTLWLILCDLARTDLYLSLNEWDDILDAKTTWGRKQYRKSFKLYK